MTDTPSKIRPAPSVVNVERVGNQTMVLGVCFENAFLILNRQGISCSLVVVGEAAIQGGDGGLHGLLS